METIKWISWFICGVIASVIYYKKYRTEKDKKDKYIGTEVLLFIWGWIGLFFIVYRWIWSKIY
jgi:hypothetical protein